MSPALLINISQIPSATRSRFLFILTVTICLACATAQRLNILPDGIFGISAPRLVLQGFVGAAVALSLAALIYLLHPLSRAGFFGRAHRLGADHPVSKRIHELSAQLGIRGPKLLMDHDIRNIDAIAFGLPGQKTILLGRGLWRMLAINPRLFDARICHELAHIRNRDIGVTFYARSLIFVNILILIIEASRYFQPAAISLWKGWIEWRANGSTIAHFLHSWAFWILEASIYAMRPLAPKLIIFSILMLCLHKAFLRTREIYADNTAAQYVGKQAMLAALIAGKAPQQRPRLATLIHSLISAHPSIDDRRSAIENPISAVRPTLSQTFWLAISVSLSITTLNNIDFSAFENEFKNDDFLIRLISSSSGIIFGLFLTFMIAPILIALVNHAFRIVAWLVIDGSTFFRAMGSLLLNSLMILLFIIAGFIFCNYTAAVFFNFDAIDDADFISSLVICAFVFTITIIYFPILRLILLSENTNRPSIFVWISISILCFLKINYITVIIMSQLIPNADKSGNAPIIFLTMIVICLWLISYIIARRSLSLKPVSTHELSPWLFAK